jgi:ankyrin repeat protein
MDLTQKFFQAIMDGDQAGVTQLLDNEPSLLNTHVPSGVPALLFAMYYGQPVIVRTLLERGAAVDVFSAAAIGITGKLRTLLAGKPDLVNAAALDGYSPLGLASFFGQKEAVELLLENGAEVNAAAVNSQRVMPLHSAVAGPHFEIAKLLLEHGALVNAEQEGGFTPLHGACQNGQVEMVKLLLDNGAEVNALSHEGRSALYFAREGSHTQVVELLEAAGAKD